MNIQEPGGAGATRRVRLADVAAAAGVSTSAASFVLNGRTDQRIPEETKERVRRAAEELGYRPNATARTLRTGTSGAYAFVSDFISSTSVANAMVRGALRELDAHGALMFAVETQGNADMERRLIEQLVDRHIDGVIYASMFTRHVAIPELPAGVRLVLLNCLPPAGAADQGVTAVVPDELGAGRAAAQVLLTAGHRDRIAFLGSFPDGMSGGQEWGGLHPLALDLRVQGITARLAESGLALVDSIPVTGWDVADGQAAAETLVGAALPSAIICANDRLALGVMRALRRHGARVPEDLSLVSFDGSQLADITDPPLASLALPLEGMGRHAALRVLEDAPSPTVELLPMPLGRTGTIAPPPLP